MLSVQSKLCRDYHIVKDGTLEEYTTEFIRRLNYEIIYKYLTQESLLHNTFLINDGIIASRDEGHQEWMLHLVHNILSYGVEYIEPNKFNLRLALYEYRKYKRIQLYKDYEYQLHETFKNMAIEDGCRYFNYVTTTSYVCELTAEDLQKYDDRFDFYREPSFYYGNGQEAKYIEMNVHNVYEWYFLDSYNREYENYLLA